MHIWPPFGNIVHIED